MFVPKAVTAALGALLLAAPLTHATCPPFSGDFNVTNFSLYPENVDFDSVHCLFYIGSTLNHTVLRVDPYTNEQEILHFPSLPQDNIHVAGIDFDARHNTVYIMGDAANPFLTGGHNLTGPNFLIKYSTIDDSVVWTADINIAQRDILASTGILTSGFQDMAEDTQGNSFVIGTFGQVIAKVTPTGEVSVFVLPAAGSDSSELGYGGIAAIPGTDTMIVADAKSQNFLVFHTSVSNAPTIIPVANFPNATAMYDAIYFPQIYDGKVLLVSDDATDRIDVLASDDCWNTATYLGAVANNDPRVVGGFPTATVEIAESIYISNAYFFDTVPDRSVYLFVDITDEISALVQAA